MSPIASPLADHPPRRPKPRGAVSLEWKLPLLMTAVFAAGLAAFLAFTYFTLARRSEATVRDRFAHASRQVASTIESSIAQRSAMMRTAAAGAPLARLLVAAESEQGITRGDSAAAREILRKLVPGRDSLPAMLVDARGKMITFAGK